MNGRILAIVCLALTLLARPAEACLAANQHKVTILGIAKGKVIALERTQTRTDTRSGAIRWYASARLVAFEPAKSGVVTSSEVLGTIEVQANLRDGAYEMWMHRIFEKAHKQARRVPGFTRSFIASALECDYLRHCRGYELGQEEMRIPGISAPLHFELPEPAQHQTYAAYAQDLDGVGIRRALTYKIGRETYVVLTLGHGMRRAPCGDDDGDSLGGEYDDCYDKRVPKKRRPPATLRESLKHEQPLHHGADYDLVIRLPKSVYGRRGASLSRTGS